MDTSPPPGTSRQFYSHSWSFRDLLLDATPLFYVTPVLVGANVAWFAILVALGVSPIEPNILELQRYGANYGPLTLEGEWWRILSSTFVHIGLLHLFFNMWCLWTLGTLAERMFGNGTFLLIYLASGLGGSLASLAWHPHVTSAGASGAVFGIAGALAAFLYLGHISVPRRLLRELQWSLLFFLGFNLLYGFLRTGIDNAGHLGGLVVGLVMGAALHRPIPVAPRSPSRFLIVPAVVIALLGTARLAIVRAESDPELLVLDALRLHARGAPEAATAKLERALELEPDLAPALIQLGYMALEAKRFDEATLALERAVQLAPDSGALRSQIGLAYLMNGRDEEAVEVLRQAVELEPRVAEHHNRLALALARFGSGDEALSAIDRALELSPDAPHLLDSLGTVRFYRGELERAAEAYRQAVERSPGVGAYHFNLGVALRNLGRGAQAEEELAEALRLEPALSEASRDEPLL